MTRMMKAAAPRTTLLAVAFVAFISLGLPDAVLGVAWPSVRDTFALSQSHLGTLLATAMVGYLVSSFGSGAAVARWGVGRVLLYSSVLVALTAFTWALAPSWWVMVAFGVVAGLGAGAIDAGINAYAAANFTPRVVNWLHACYGVGAMCGPLLMTAVLTGGPSWRWGYGIIGVLLAGMSACFWLTLNLWQVRPADEGGPQPMPAPAPASAPAEVPVSARQALRRPAVWLGVVFFLVYTGLEVTAGQWAFTLFTESPSRGASTATAGVWVGLYWGSLTAGRVAFGAAAHHVAPTILLRIGLTGAPLAALLIWLSPGGLLTGFLGLALLGFSLAPIYPLMISGTPKRVGEAAAAHAVGFQVSAAYLGAAALPGTAGLIARYGGLEGIGPFLFGAALVLVMLYELTVAHSRRRAGQELPSDGLTGPHPARV